MRGAFEAASHGLPQGVEVVTARVVPQRGETGRGGGKKTEKEERMSAIGVGKRGEEGRKGGRERRRKRKKRRRREEKVWLTRAPGQLALSTRRHGGREGKRL